MDEEGFQTMRSVAVKKGAGGLLHQRARLEEGKGKLRVSACQGEGPRDRQAGTFATLLTPPPKVLWAIRGALGTPAKGDTAGWTAGRVSTPGESRVRTGCLSGPVSYREQIPEVMIPSGGLVGECPPISKADAKFLQRIQDHLSD